jgi:hypothetical protein
MKKEEGNMISDWIAIHGDTQIEIQVLNEVIDSLLQQQDEFALGFANWLDDLIIDNITLYNSKKMKELLEIYKKEKGL